VTAIDFIPLFAAAIHPLATADAVLNSIAAVLLVTGWVLIKRGHETAHKWTMLAALGVSSAFLICYLTYHFTVGATNFGGSGPIRSFYYSLLFSHVMLAATVPVLAIWTAVLGLKDRRLAHRRLATWTFPIWLYASVTGVIVYVMLYHLYPSAS
jgi:putative membrane protein